MERRVSQRDVELANYWLERMFGQSTQNIQTYTTDSTQLYQRHLEEVKEKARQAGESQVMRWVEEQRRMQLDIQHPATMTTEQLKEYIDRLKSEIQHATDDKIQTLKQKVGAVELEVERRSDLLLERLDEIAQSPRMRLTIRLEDLTGKLEALSNQQAIATQFGFAQLNQTIADAFAVNWEDAMKEMIKAAENLKLEKVKEVAERTYR